MHNIYGLIILILVNYLSKHIKTLVEAYFLLRNEHHLIMLNKIFIKFNLNFEIMNILLLDTIFLTKYFPLIILCYKIFQIYKLNISLQILKYNIILYFDQILSFYILGLLYPFYIGLLFCFLDPELYYKS